ncbi:atrial natriuretic peptide receptor 1-like [Paramacrobiotus metropolitanus]|uniref:atrial natriuretic peptide receptor 1-like n=1 Tax=Paramacrobiotus metropolitanus TaxID=2943436 RepID=UPI0024462290|nr:atrial natriuretic peptide receptor 1-like [Paramacrobiotus metropolitanus]
MCTGKSVVNGIEVDIVSLITLSGKTPSSAFSLAAMDMAVEDVQKLHGSVANFTHVRLTGPEMDTCETIADWSDFYLARWYYGTHRQNRQQAFPVFIWPACLESTRTRLLAAAWNILFITSAGSDAAIRDRAKGPTWISMSMGSVPGYVGLYINLLRTYRWSSVFVIIDEASLGFYMETSAAFLRATEEFAKNITLTVRRLSSAKSADFEMVLQDFKKLSRVLVFFGHAPVLRNIMIKAALANMTNGEFVYMASQLMPNRVTGNFTWNYGDAHDQIAREAFRSVLLLDQFRDASSKRLSILQLATEFQRREAADYNLTISTNDAMVGMPSYIAITLYGQIVAEMVTSNQTDELRDGDQMAKRFFNKTFDTTAGRIYIDRYGQRLMDLVVIRYDGSDGSPRPIFYQQAQTFILQQTANWTWNGSLNYFPPNKPPCGFSGNDCFESDGLAKTYTIVIVIMALIFLCIITAVLIFFKFRSYWVIQVFDNWWTLNPDLFSLNSSIFLTDMLRKEMGNTIGVTYAMLQAKLLAMLLTRSKSVEKNASNATYNKQPVWIATAVVINLHHEVGTNKPSADFRAFIKQIRAANSHTNINRLIGILTLNDRSFVLSEKAGRGSLHDLFDRNFQLDQDLKQSFMNDLCEGMNFIHSTLATFHGHLTGSKCLIDKHFVLKIGEFGCDALKSLLEKGKIVTTEFLEKDFPWRAPEILKHLSMPNRATDVYAVGVILVEILTSEYPYFDEECDSKQLLEKISAGEVTPLTAPKEGLIIRRHLLACIESTFDLDPNKRPTMLKLQRTLTGREEFGRIIKRSDRLLDKIMARLDRYAADLEERVIKQTNELIKEKAQCDVILRQILPGNIVDKLRRSEHVDAEIFESVTVMFFDLPGFEELIQTKHPRDLTVLLDVVESLLDISILDVDAFKVESVSNTFMVVSGAPVRNGTQHVAEICKLAVSLRKKLRKALDDKGLQFRTGLHSGSIAAGVVGHRKPRYCLFGDTVNTASRMMSHGLPGHIQMSCISADVLRKNYPDFRLLSRGIVQVKNKAPMETFWLM